MPSNVTKPPILDETGQEIKEKLLKIQRGLPNIKGDRYLSPTPFVYSESEEQVGVWIDGKPIYQKTFPITTAITFTADTWVQTTIDASNIGNIVGSFITNNVGAMLIVSCAIVSNKVALNSPRTVAITANTSEITIQYTKSSDMAGQGGYKAYGFSPIIYSTEERVVGVWKDGLPLYQKTWELNVPSTASGGAHTFYNPVPNLKEVVYTEYSVDGIGEKDYSVYASSINANISFEHQSATIIEFSFDGSYYAGKKIYYTSRYTKTTDVAGSGKYVPVGIPAVHYSTDEQVIGTWIDGKTLYQKTFNTTTPSTAGTGAFVLDVGSDGVIQKYDGYIVASNNSANGIDVYRDSSNYSQAWRGANKHQLAMQVSGANYVNRPAVITVQYTKTS